jgi:hypothetical protein
MHTHVLPPEQTAETVPYQLGLVNLTRSWYKKISNSINRKVFEMFSHLPDTIVYVRHPECVHNISYAEATKALQSGISNKASPITDRGRLQCWFTAQYFQRVFGHFDSTFASDFIRTHAIPIEMGVDFVIEPRIGERWQGELHERGDAFLRNFQKRRRST